MSRRAEATLARAAPVYAALGDATRLRLLEKLAEGEPLSIAQLTTGADISRQAITKHLRVLAGAGLVRDERLGRERRWALEPGRLTEARSGLDALSRRWDEALARLKAFVETE
ncbi:MAG: metalloregulator ArsR/SmtB family transcription factor [Anaeromyxobacter sp.]